MVHEQWAGKHVEGSSCGLIWVVSWHFPGWKPRKTSVRTGGVAAERRIEHRPTAIKNLEPTSSVSGRIRSCDTMRFEQNSYNLLYRFLVWHIYYYCYSFSFCFCKELNTHMHVLPTRVCKFPTDINLREGEIGIPETIIYSVFIYYLFWLYISMTCKNDLYLI
jgi:hypothetical protein